MLILKQFWIRKINIEWVDQHKSEHIEYNLKLWWNPESGIVINQAKWNK